MKCLWILQKILQQELLLPPTKLTQHSKSARSYISHSFGKANCATTHMAAILSTFCVIIIIYFFSDQLLRLFSFSYHSSTVSTRVKFMLKFSFYSFLPQSGMHSMVINAHLDGHYPPLIF